MSTNSTTGGSGVFGSLSSSKKDSLKQAGELAVNLFDKLKNKKAPSQNNSSSTSNSSSIPQSSSFSSLIASTIDSHISTSSSPGLFQNLAISFQKSLLNNQNSVSTSDHSTSALSSRNSARKSSSLVVIDDESFDDDEASFHIDNGATKLQSNIKTSQSEFTLKNNSIGDEEKKEPASSFITPNSDSKLASTFSFQKANESVCSEESSLHNEKTNVEVGLLRRRFQNRSDSNEVSSDDIKNTVKFFILR